tara:strand:+ start:456 stop:689 length:234 start_codon:yes stop_codon:yes gene_type:complete
MNNVTLNMKMTQKQAGAMYIKLCETEDKLKQLNDYITHHHDWVRACEIAKENPDEPVDVAYWQKQIDTLKKLKTKNY